MTTPAPTSLASCSSSSSPPSACEASPSTRCPICRGIQTIRHAMPASIRPADAYEDQWRRRNPPIRRYSDMEEAKAARSADRPDHTVVVEDRVERRVVRLRLEIVYI